MIVDAGIDYLRVTIQPGQNLRPWLHEWKGLIDDSVFDCHKTKPWKWQGYEGTECNGFYYGGREDGFLFEARGSAANVAFQRTKNLELVGNVPRLDVKVDTQGTEELSDETEALFDYLRVPKHEGQAKRDRSLAIQRPRGGADSLYCGSRNSGSYLCIYSASAKHPDKFSEPTRRYECRYSNDTAKDRYTHCKNSASITCIATSLVIGHLMSIGLERPWFKDTPPIAPMRHYTPTDDEKSLKWIESHVAGTIRRLIRNGHGEELADIIGVKELALIPELCASKTFISAEKSGDKKRKGKS
jgi:hypothetical protein